MALLLLPTLQTGTSHPLPFRSRVGRRFPEIKADHWSSFKLGNFRWGEEGRKGGWLKKCGIKREKIVKDSGREKEGEMKKKRYGREGSKE
jgi:hypothetical protein